MTDEPVLDSRTGLPIDPELLKLDDDYLHNLLMRIRDDAEKIEALTDLFQEQERTIAILEKENRKLSDKLNRFRNLTPGRKRLHALGRIAATLEYEADEIEKRIAGREVDQGGLAEAVNRIDRLYVGANRQDALYLHRLQWDFEQLREVVYPSKQPGHEWRRP